MCEAAACADRYQWLRKTGNYRTYSWVFCHWPRGMFFVPSELQRKRPALVHTINPDKAAIWKIKCEISVAWSRGWILWHDNDVSDQRCICVSIRRRGMVWGMPGSRGIIGGLVSILEGPQSLPGWTLSAWVAAGSSMKTRHNTNTNMVASSACLCWQLKIPSVLRELTILCSRPSAHRGDKLLCPFLET